MNVINGKLGYDAVENIDYSVKDVTLVEIPLDKNNEIFAQLTNQPSCREEVDRLLSQREFVCQGQAVLSATVAYSIKVRAAGAAEGVADVAEIREVLSADVDSGISVDGEKLVFGDALYYGMRVNPTCNARREDVLPRRLPKDQFDRIRNFIQFDVLQRS
jgi:hypothetical protein